jgi:hypothetical protein
MSFALQAAVDLLLAWRRVPKQRDWKLFCQGILLCADIEFADGVILNIAFSSRKFQMMMAEVLTTLVQNSATTLQLAWLCSVARSRTNKMRQRSPRKRRYKKKHEGSGSRFMDDFPFSPAEGVTSQYSSSQHDDGMGVGYFQHQGDGSEAGGGYDNDSVGTDLTDATCFNNQPSFSSGRHRPIKKHNARQKSLSAGDESLQSLVKTHDSPFPGSGLEGEGNNDDHAHELQEIRDQLSSVMEQLKHAPETNSAHLTGMSSSFVPHGSIVSSAVSEEVVEEVHVLQQSVNRHVAICEELKQQFLELKQGNSLKALDTASVYSVYQEDNAELKSELQALREAQLAYENKNKSVLATFVKALEKTSQLAEEMKECNKLEQTSFEASSSMVEGSPTKNVSEERNEHHGHSEEYKYLKAQVEKDQAEKDMDIAYLKTSIEKLTRGLKQSKMHYDDLEHESKQQHNRLKEEYEALQRRMLDMKSGQHSMKEAPQSSHKTLSSSSKTSLKSFKSQKDGIVQEMDVTFQKGLDHAISTGDNEQINKLQEYKKSSNRRRMYSSLDNIKYQKLLRSIGVDVMDESQYNVATNKDKLITIRQLQQVKRVSRFLNIGALRWRLQVLDPSYGELAVSFIGIIATNKSAATLSDALRLGVRVRHEDLTVVALGQIVKLLTQAYEKNSKYFAPTLYALLGGASNLAQVMRVFFMSSSVQHACLQVITCIFESSRTLSELDSVLSPRTSGVFAAVIRVLLWHGSSVELCLNALQTAKEMTLKCQSAKESFCTMKQIKALLGFATGSMQTVALFECYVSFVCVLSSESLPLVQRLSDGGLSAQFSRCLQLKYESEPIVTIIMRAILSLFSSHGPIFIQEMFGNKEFFLASVKCLSAYTNEPKVFKLVDMCFLAVCGQNLRIISRIPENEISDLMMKVLGDKNLDALVVMPALMSINVACLNQSVLQAFYSSGVHTLIARVLFESKNTEMREYAKKTHRIIADVDPVAKRAEEDRVENLRLQEKQAARQRIAQIEIDRQEADRLAEECEKGAARVGQFKDEAKKILSNSKDEEMSARMLAKIEMEKKTKAQVEKLQSEEMAVLKEKEKELDRQRKAEQVSKLKEELDEADRKAQLAIEQQEADRVARAIAMQEATEVIAVDFFEEDIARIAQKEHRREEARVEKAKLEEAAAVQIADMQEQIESAERSVLLGKDNQRAQIAAEREEAEREVLVAKKKQQQEEEAEAEASSQDLFTEEYNRKLKEEEVAVLKEKEEDKRKAEQMTKLRDELDEADRKAQLAIEQQEADRVARAIAMQEATEVIAVDFFEEEIARIAQKEHRREEARVEKAKLEEAAAVQIADMQEQIESAERSAQLSAELEKADHRAQIAAEREEAERELLVKKKQQEAEKIAQDLFTEEYNRKVQRKAKEKRVIHEIMNQKDEEDLFVAEDKKQVQQVDNNNAVTTIVENDEASAKIVLTNTKKSREKGEKEIAFLEKVKAKKEAKKLAKRQARKAEASRKAEMLLDDL